MINMPSTSGNMGANCFQEFGQNIYARPLPRVYAIFLFAIEYSAKAQHTTTVPRAEGGTPHRGRALLLYVEPWLNTQWQTEKQHILLAEDGHIFLTCLQLVGTWVKNIFRNLVLDFLTCPQLVGTWVKHIFRNLVPVFWRVMLFLACHVLNVACHGVSISIVSISSVSCRVRILRVSVSMPCHGHPDNHHLQLWYAFRTKR